MTLDRLLPIEDLAARFTSPDPAFSPVPIWWRRAVFGPGALHCGGGRIKLGN
jgi:hypothetical protein